MAAAPDSEEGFLGLIAERPDDRSLRRVFADWLLEREDARGEALALWAKGELSSAERRRLDKLTRAHAQRWLGPLAPAVAEDHHGLPRCRFDGGLLSEVHFRPVELHQWTALTGQPRLGTVTTLGFPPREIRLGADPAGFTRLIPVSTPADEFVVHPVLRHVTALECGAKVLPSAGRAAFTLQRLKLHSWAHHADLEALGREARLASAKDLVLVLHDRGQEVGRQVLEPDAVEPLLEDLFSSPALREREHFELSVRSAIIEGAAQFLLQAAVQLRRQKRTHFAQFGLRYHDTLFALEGQYFDRLVVDPGEPEGEWTVDSRLTAAAATVIALLGGAALERIEVKAPRGGRVTRDELNALRAAARRLRSLESLVVAGVPQPP